MKKIHIYFWAMLVCASAFGQNKTQDRSMVVEESTQEVLPLSFLTIQ
mgnify:CR=1 FL=1